MVARLAMGMGVLCVMGVRGFAPLARPVARTRGLFAVQPQVSYDASFTLTEKEWAQLDAYLTHEDMLRKVCDEADCGSARFTGAVFSPVAFSAETPHGMPAAIEPFHHSEKYVICNVPAIVLFKSKILRPQKLCAVYEMHQPRNLNPNNNSAYQPKTPAEDSDDLWLPDDEGDEDDFDYAGSMI